MSNPVPRDLRAPLIIEGYRGDERESYRVARKVLDHLPSGEWRLIVAGGSLMRVRVLRGDGWERYHWRFPTFLDHLSVFWHDLIGRSNVIQAVRVPDPEDA